LGLAIYCPVVLDDEVGPFLFRKPMEQGYYCRPLSEFTNKIEVHLRPSQYTDPSIFDSSIDTSKLISDEIVSEFTSTPTAIRQRKNKVMMLDDHRTHAVCTVQTFMHTFSGPMLYMFVAYYQMMGWR
jgi:hypothetical protein